MGDDEGEKPPDQPQEYRLQQVMMVREVTQSAKASQVCPGAERGMPTLETTVPLLTEFCFDEPDVYVFVRINEVSERHRRLGARALHLHLKPETAAPYVRGNRPPFCGGSAGPQIPAGPIVQAATTAQRFFAITEWGRVPQGILLGGSADVR